MELFLNFAWAGLALASMVLWLRCGRHDKRRWYLPVVALAMLVVLLFPVISVSDDLWAIQNPAESDVWVRRDLDHGVAPALLLFAALPVIVFAGLAMCRQGRAMLSHDASLPGVAFAGHPFQNKPPPQF